MKQAPLASATMLAREAKGPAHRHRKLKYEKVGGRTRAQSRPVCCQIEAEQIKEGLRKPRKAEEERLAWESQAAAYKGCGERKSLGLWPGYALSFLLWQQRALHRPGHLSKVLRA